MRRIPLVAVACFLLAPPAFAQGTGKLDVKSPDGNLQISLDLKSRPAPYLPGERAYYSVTFKGDPLLADSPLGIEFEGAPPLDHDFEVVGQSRRTVDESWKNKFGARRHVRDHYQELEVSLREKQPPGRRLDLIFRAYDEGVAFRYSLPQQPGLDRFVISAERTGFYFAREAYGWALDLGSYTTPYEHEYLRESFVDIRPDSIVGLPLLVETPGGPWSALLESDLTDYAGMYVGGATGAGNKVIDNAIVSKLSPLPGHPGEAVIGQVPKMTPWRVLLVGLTPGSLIENSDLVLNLSQPNSLKDTSWIEPGKAAWDWWSGSYAANVQFKPGMNTATMEHYVDFAAEHHFEYMLIDAGWAPHGEGYEQEDITRYVPEVDVPAIVAHAHQKHVKVMLWCHWTNVKKQADVAFPLFEKWGVSGVKVDFMNRDDQEMVNFYQETVAKAAEHHLTVDFHGAYKPTGLRRTYPNLLTREGVMGLEYSKVSYRETPMHTTTIPFTRMLAGPMDYTPGCFSNATREQFRPREVQPMCQGTRASQLAMYVVYLSPLVMISDYPENYDHKPGMEFLDKVPTVWDETIVPNGEPARFVTIARRNGANWYLGAMTNWESRDLDIPLTFLRDDQNPTSGKQRYEAQIFADGPDAEKDATSLSITKKSVTAGDTLKLHLAPGGGAAVIFTPVK